MLSMLLTKLTRPQEERGGETAGAGAEANF